MNNVNTIIINNTIGLKQYLIYVYIFKNKDSLIILKNKWSITIQ